MQAIVVAPKLNFPGKFRQFKQGQDRAVAECLMPFQELNNGRLAMIAITGLVAQA